MSGYEANQGYGSMADEGREVGQVVEALFRHRVEDAVSMTWQDTVLDWKSIPALPLSDPHERALASYRGLTGHA